MTWFAGLFRLKGKSTFRAAGREIRVDTPGISINDTGSLHVANIEATTDRWPVDVNEILGKIPRAFRER